VAAAEYPRTGFDIGAPTQRAGFVCLELLPSLPSSPGEERKGRGREITREKDEGGPGDNDISFRYFRRDSARATVKPYLPRISIRIHMLRK